MLLGLPVPNSCANQLKHPKSTQSSRTLFESGEMAVTLPTAALAGCGFGSLKRETEESTSDYLVTWSESLAIQ